MSDTSTVLNDQQSEYKCVLCNNSNDKLLFTAKAFSGEKNYSIKQCNHCKIVYTFPIQSLNDLDNSYSDEYYGGVESKFSNVIEYWTKLAASQRARKFLKQYYSLQKSNISSQQPLNILDIGCGRGVLLDAFIEAGHKATGYERNGAPFDSLSDNIQCCELEDLQLDEQGLDIVIIWHVLEHLSSPAQILEFTRKVLKPGGSLFISVPNFNSFQSRLFKDKWFHLDLPMHLFHFDQTTLNNILLDNGFKIKATNMFSFDQNLFGFIQSSLNVVISKLLPSLDNNHFYSTLKANSSWYSKLSLFLYIPLLIPITIFAFVEILLSLLLKRGACINIQCEKIDHVK